MSNAFNTIQIAQQVTQLEMEANQFRVLAIEARDKALAAISRLAQINTRDMAEYKRALREIDAFRDEYHHYHQHALQLSQKAKDLNFLLNMSQTV